MTKTAIALAATLLAGCATTPVGLPPVPVYAKAETAPVGTVNDDAADDPAIWRNAADPAASLIVATDKKAGLYVYGLDGAIRSFAEAGAVNNVDLVDMPNGDVIVVASDRNDLANAAIRVYRLDTAAGSLDPIGAVRTGAGEGYGLCLHREGNRVWAWSPVKEGQIYGQLLDVADGVTVVSERAYSVPSQPEGCVVDPRNGTLYVGEEAAGIWRFAAGATGGELVAPIDNRYMVADVEGLAIAPDGTDAGYLVASSQGDNAFAVYRLPDMAPVGRFAIGAGTFGATEETDGIDLILGDFGPDYPEGLFVAQDGINAPAAQNFKLVAWADIKAALGL